MCLSYLFSRLEGAIVLPWCSAQRIRNIHDCQWQSSLDSRNSPADCYRQSLVPYGYRKRTKPKLGSFFVFALPIFTASHPATIVGVHVLNFCVRDGNRWTHMTINTNFGDPYRIRTDVNGVRGRCLNHLTNGPLVHLQGLEPGTH